MAIDPGPSESALLGYDTETKLPVTWEKTSNWSVLRAITQYCWKLDYRSLAIEMVASYGMAVGSEVFETCVWIGRFLEKWRCPGVVPDGLLVYRRNVKLHLCGSVRAKDANVRQALIDRYGGKEKAIGKKATPGPLYGMSGDCWSALAVAITAAESS